jgi:hypothetical protein
MSELPPLPRASRPGLVLFTIYCVGYGGFMLVAAFRGSLLKSEPALGLNLAVWWGLALIGGAVLFAGLYLWLSRKEA